MNNYYALINKLTVKLGNRAEVIGLLLESGEPFKTNPSCIRYLVYEDAKDQNVIWVEDVWTSKEDHTAALARPDLEPLIAKTIPMLEGLPEQHQIFLAGGKGL